MDCYHTCKTAVFVGRPGIDDRLIKITEIPAGVTAKVDRDLHGNPLNAGNYIHVYYLIPASETSQKMGEHILSPADTVLMLGAAGFNELGEVNLYNPYNPIPSVDVFNNTPFQVELFYQGKPVGMLSPAVGHTRSLSFGSVAGPSPGGAWMLHFSNYGNGLAPGDILGFRYLLNGKRIGSTMNVQITSTYTRQINIGTIAPTLQ